MTGLESRGYPGSAPEPHPTFSMSQAQITAIVTAYQRIDQTLGTLKKLRACRPAPEEILVHVDGNQTQCEAAIRRAFPEIKLLRSEKSVGPGGGRNKLVAQAKH